MIRGVKSLVFNEKDEVLLVRLAYSHRKWTLPGGGVEAKESFAHAAVRELQEETGIHLENLTFFTEYRGTNPEPHPVQCFVAKIQSQPTSPQPGEIEEVNWFPANSLPGNRADSVDMILDLFHKFNLPSTRTDEIGARNDEFLQLVKKIA